MYRRSKDVDVNETPEENGDPLSGSSDPFDALVNSKPTDDSATKSNGKNGPSPIPDDSDGEKDDNEISKNNDDKSETNGESADSADAKDDDDEGYEVENIVGHKFKGKKKLFKIRWKNYDESQDTWEPEEDLSCPEIIEQYLEEHPEAKGPKPTKAKKVSKFRLVFVRPSRWHDFNSNNNDVLLKVRISLPQAESSRTTPKRTAAERKAIVDDPLSDSDESDKKKTPTKRGRPKKGGANAKSSGKTNKEFEVQKIIDDEMRGGKKYYRIRWKGWSAKDDTWEPKTSLSCPEIIKAYESAKQDDDDDDAEYEVEKIVGEKIEYGVRYFLVKWKGWPESDNTWEDEKSVDCYDLIEKFRDSCRSANKSNKRPAKTSPKASKAKKARKNVSDDEDDDSNDDEESEKEWEVEKVVNQRTGKGGKKQYLIRWKGCKASDDTWEPEDGINCPELIAAFLKKNKK